jgi:hypothetical protein
MATISKSIDVPGVRSEVADAWTRFIESVLVGSRRLACDELACVDPLNTELVGFEDLGGGRTRVNVTLPIPGDTSDGVADLLSHKASHDLVLFWDYIETGDYRRDHVADAVAGTEIKEEMRSGRLAAYDTHMDGGSLSVGRQG